MSLQKSNNPLDSVNAAPKRDHSALFQTCRRPDIPNVSALDTPDRYYGTEHGSRRVSKSRTFSNTDAGGNPFHSARIFARRLSGDTAGTVPMQWLIDVDETRKNLLEQEDTDGNVQITIDDHGPKTIELRTERSGGIRHTAIRGTYMLSNLLQELTIAQDYHQRHIVLDESRLNEDPVNRLARLIRDQFWENLTRRIDGSNVEKVAQDPKDWTSDPRPRIYVPKGAPEYFEYYTRIAREHPHYRLDVRWLDECAATESAAADDYVRDLNNAPGLLAIAMERISDTKKGEPDFKGIPFVVPGGRFNELYGWDSYMETLGLIINHKAHIAEGMVRHFCFCIRHYGKILNANRTYYLRRSQPPFLTDMALRVYEVISHKPHAKEFLKEAILASIKDYYCTWMSAPRYDPESGLSRYHPGGRGVPPETEATHFVHVLQPYADKYGLSFEEFVKAYNYGDIKGLSAAKHAQWEADQKELNEYFRHDRAVRESGHDTSYRLERVAADLATVDLNSLLFKYEVDIGCAIKEIFGGHLEIPDEWHVKGKPKVETAASWERRHKQRHALMEKLMWNAKEGMFFDYNVVTKEQTGYESATMFWAMWAGACSGQHAKIMVQNALPKLEKWGGLASGTEKSRGKIDKHRPNRQWDYPFGWAPQQILAWVGLRRYGFNDEAERLAYRWLHMVSKAYYDFNGVVVEKYDVTQQTHPHKVTAEYGNQGGDFKGAAKEGFGWVNASFVFGLDILGVHQRRALGALTPWDTFEKTTMAMQSPDESVRQEAKINAFDMFMSPSPRRHPGPVEKPEPHSQADMIGHRLDYERQHQEQQQREHGHEVHCSPASQPHSDPTTTSVITPASSLDAHGVPLEKPLHKAVAETSPKVVQAVASV